MVNRRLLTVWAPRTQEYLIVFRGMSKDIWYAQLSIYPLMCITASPVVSHVT